MAVMTARKKEALEARKTAQEHPVPVNNDIVHEVVEPTPVQPEEPKMSLPAQPTQTDQIQRQLEQYRNMIDGLVATNKRLMEYVDRLLSCNESLLRTNEAQSKKLDECTSHQSQLYPRPTAPMHHQPPAAPYPYPPMHPQPPVWPSPMHNFQNPPPNLRPAIGPYGEGFNPNAIQPGLGSKEFQSASRRSFYNPQAQGHEEVIGQPDPSMAAPEPKPEIPTYATSNPNVQEVKEELTPVPTQPVEPLKTPLNYEDKLKELLESVTAKFIQDMKS